MSQLPQFDGVIGFLGAGRMAQALAGGIVEAGLAPPDRMIAYNPSSGAAEEFAKAVGQGAVLAKTPEEVGKAAQIVFLAVKPVYAQEALEPILADWRDEQLLVSVAAGVKLSTLEKWLPKKAAAIRVMPNTPCLIGHGACCYSLGKEATSEQGETVGQLLSAVGYSSEVPERLLDAVTGVSGSGPAYIYTVIEALADGGVRAGLPRKLAAELAARTVAGAAAMVIETGQHPAQLRDAVASPGGTTIAGLAELERQGIRTALIETVTAAANRSKELGND